MNRITAALVLSSACLFGCDGSDDSAEQVRIAALGFDLEGRDVCLFSDDQTRRLSPSNDALDLTEPVRVHLADEIFAAVVEPTQSCESAQRVLVERFDSEPDFNDDTDERTVVLAAGADALTATMHFEVEGEFTTARSCTPGDSYVVRRSMCSSSGTTTTVSLYECQMIPLLGEPPVAGYVRTGQWTTTSGGGCDEGGPGGSPQE